MRSLSLAQASRCETAQHERCRCRCGGKLHGAMRNFIEEDRQNLPEHEFFETLSEDDPHHVRSRAEQNRRRRLKHVAEKVKDQGLLWTIFAEKD